ncbi:hypothetical protein PCE1_001345 [Barthelona sp. PCE]
MSIAHAGIITGVHATCDNVLSVDRSGIAILSYPHLDPYKKHVFTDLEPTSCVIFDERIIIGFATGEIKMFNLDFDELFSIQLHTKKVYTMDISPDGTLLISGGADKNIVVSIVNQDSLEEIHRFDKLHNGSIEKLHFDPTSFAFLSAGRDKKINFVDLETKENVYTEVFEGNMKSAAFSHDGLGYAGVDGSNNVGIFDENGESVFKTKLETKLTRVAVSSEQVFVGNVKGYVFVFGLDSSEKEYTKVAQIKVGHTSISEMYYYTDDEEIEYIYVGSNNGYLARINIETGDVDKSIMPEERVKTSRESRSRSGKRESKGRSNRESRNRESRSRESRSRNNKRDSPREETSHSLRRSRQQLCEPCPTKGCVDHAGILRASLKNDERYIIIRNATDKTEFEIPITQHEDTPRNLVWTPDNDEVMVVSRNRISAVSIPLKKETWQVDAHTSTDIVKNKRYVAFRSGKVICRYDLSRKRKTLLRETRAEPPLRLHSLRILKMSHELLHISYSDNSHMVFNLRNNDVVYRYNHDGVFEIGFQFGTSLLLFHMGGYEGTGVFATDGEYRCVIDSLLSNSTANINDLRMFTEDEVGFLFFISNLVYVVPFDGSSCVEYMLEDDVVDVKNGIVYVIYNEELTNIRDMIDDINGIGGSGTPIEASQTHVVVEPVIETIIIEPTVEPTIEPTVEPTIEPTIEHIEVVKQEVEVVAPEINVIIPICTVNGNNRLHIGSTAVYQASQRVFYDNDLNSCSIYSDSKAGNFGLSDKIYYKVVSVGEDAECLTLSPKGSSFVVSSASELRVYSTESTQLVYTIMTPLAFAYLNEKTLLVANNGCLFSVDLRTGFISLVKALSTSNIVSITIAMNRYVFVVFEDNTATTVDYVTMRSFNTFSGVVRGCAYNDVHVLIVNSIFPNAVGVFNFTTGAESHKFAVSGDITSVRSHNKKVLLSTKFEVLVFESDVFTNTHKLREKNCIMAFAPDTNIIAHKIEGGVKITNIKNDVCANIVTPSKTSSLSITYDGSMLAAMNGECVNLYKSVTVEGLPFEFVGPTNVHVSTRLWNDTVQVTVMSTDKETIFRDDVRRGFFCFAQNRTLVVPQALSSTQNILKLDSDGRLHVILNNYLHIINLVTFEVESIEDYIPLTSTLALLHNKQSKAIKLTYLPSFPDVIYEIEVNGEFSTPQSEQFGTIIVDDTIVCVEKSSGRYITKSMRFESVNVTNESIILDTGIAKVIINESDFNDSLATPTGIVDTIKEFEAYEINPEHVEMFVGVLSNGLPFLDQLADVTPLIGSAVKAVNILIGAFCRMKAAKLRASVLTHRVVCISYDIYVISHDNKYILEHDSIARHIRGIKSVVEEITEYINEFQDRGWIKRVMSSVSKGDIDKMNVFNTTLDRVTADLRTSLAVFTATHALHTPPPSLSAADLEALMNRDHNASMQLDEVAAQLTNIQSGVDTLIEKFDAVIDGVNAIPDEIPWENLGISDDNVPDAEGGMAYVYFGVYNLEDIAIKVAKSKRAEERLLHEYNTIMAIKSSGIVRVFGLTRSPSGFIGLVMQRLSYCLDDVKYINTLSLTDRFRILEDLSKALQVCHAFNFMHRDIKPENVLLDKRNNAFLSDFNIAKDSNEQNATVQLGTVMYTAPELMTQNKRVYKPEMDVYSFGLTMLFLLTGGVNLFSDVFVPAIQSNITYVRLLRCEWIELEELVNRCCSRNPELRPTFAEISGLLVPEKYSQYSNMNIDIEDYNLPN